MIMRASQDEESASKIGPDADRSIDHEVADIGLYRYVPPDPRWRTVRLDAAHTRIRRPHSLRVVPYVEAESQFMNSTLYLG